MLRLQEFKLNTEEEGLTVVVFRNRGRAGTTMNS
jgi:hypothetical protein